MTGISIDQISKDLKISKSCISHTFSEKFRIPFRTYINTLRLREAVKLLENTSKSITEIAAESGFETIRTFNRSFTQSFGISPSQYRKGKQST
ncbi:MAG: helix-turn-helix transcriptional regulator [Clostridia bacterium]|nr:helix-turn-helix transcriptional regulator [Clostridia bacterium]